MTTLRKYIRVPRHSTRRFFTRDEAVLVRRLSLPAFIAGVGLALVVVGIL